MSSPTSRSLHYLRESGMEAQVVEKWNVHARIRQDLFGCIDIVAVHHDKPGIYGIQACAGSSVSARVNKSIAEPRLRHWLHAGAHFHVHGWAKRGARGKPKRWALRVVTIILDESGQVVVGSDSSNSTVE
jgi:hypothetical protein